MEDTAPRPSAAPVRGQVGASKVVPLMMLHNIRGALRSPVKRMFDEKARKFGKYRANAVWQHQTMLIIKDEELFKFGFSKLSSKAKGHLDAVFRSYGKKVESLEEKVKGPSQLICPETLGMSKTFEVDDRGMVTRSKLMEDSKNASFFTTVSLDSYN